jgi:hypothetical protein
LPIWPAANRKSPARTASENGSAAVALAGERKYSGGAGLACGGRHRASRERHQSRSAAGSSFPHLHHVRVPDAAPQVGAGPFGDLAVFVADAVELVFLELLQIEQGVVPALCRPDQLVRA